MSAFIALLEGAGQLVGGGAIGLGMTQAYENLKFFMNKTLNLSGDWLLSWQLLDTDQEDHWETGTAQLNYGFGRITVTFAPENFARGWTARLRSGPNRGLSGNWKGLNRNAEGDGSIALIVSPDGSYLFGSLLGINNSGQRKVQNIALGRSEEALHAARGMLSSSEIHASEAVLRPLRRKYHQYHSTVIADRKVWIASTLDFSQCVRSGYLLAYTDLIPKSGSRHTFEFKGLIKGDTLVLFVTGIDFRQTPNVWIYSHFTQTYLRVIPGMLSHYTWDMSRRYSQCLICPEPLIPGIADGEVDAGQCVTLEAEWAKTIATVSPLNFSH